MGDNKSSWLSAIPYLGSAISAVNSIFSKDRTQEYLDKQYQYNVQMWNMQNAYNTPANQAARLKAGGFNPMFYGPDGNTAQQLSPVDVAGAANASSTKEQVRLQKEQQAMQTAQNIANINLTKAETAKVDAERNNVELQNEREAYNRDNKGWFYNLLNTYWSGNLTASQAVSAMVDNFVKNNKYGVHQVPDNSLGMPSNQVYDYEKGYSLQIDDLKAKLWNDAELESILTSNNVNRAKQRSLINSIAVALRNIKMLEDLNGSKKAQIDAETSLTEFTHQMQEAGLNPNDNIILRWLSNTFGHYFGNVRPDLRTGEQKDLDKIKWKRKDGFHSTTTTNHF